MARGDDGSGKYGGGFKLFGVNINLRDGLYKKSSSSESMKNKKKSYEAESITKKRSHEGDDDCMRKSKSMGNLHEMYNPEEHQSGPSGFGGGDDGSGGVGGGDVFGGVGDASGVVGGDYVSGGGDSGYHSDGVLHVNSRRAAHMRRKGTPWTPSEHRSFLMGLKKLGKGDWKGISKNYVSTRTPTQVASHAQKYFIRMTTAEKKNRRASLFDIPFKESNLPPHAPTAAPFNASEGSPQVTDAAVAPLKRTTETRGLDWPSAHTVASEKKPPLSPMTRNFVPDTGRLPFMAGVPGQSFPAAPVMPQTELYPMMNHTNYQYPNYYYVPSSHGNFLAPFTNQKPNGMFLQPFPSLYVTSQARPTAGSFATAAPLPNYYQTATGPPTSFAACAPIPNQYPTAHGPATSFAACAPFPNQFPTANGPATGTVDKKDGLEARIGTMSL